MTLDRERIEHLLRVCEAAPQDGWEPQGGYDGVVIPALDACRSCDSIHGDEAAAFLTTFTPAVVRGLLLALQGRPGT